MQVLQYMHVFAVFTLYHSYTLVYNNYMHVHMKKGTCHNGRVPFMKTKGITSGHIFGTLRKDQRAMPLYCRIHSRRVRCLVACPRS